MSRFGRGDIIYGAVLVVCMAGLVGEVWGLNAQIRRLDRVIQTQQFDLATAAQDRTDAARDRENMARSVRSRNRLAVLMAGKLGITQDQIDATLDDDPFGR